MGHHNPQDQEIDCENMPQPVFFFKADAEFGFLCQWYRGYFVHEEITFNCAEQWMMWRKAKIAGDEATARNILKTKDPRMQKSWGRKVKGFDEQKWDGSEFAAIHVIALWSADIIRS